MLSDLSQPSRPTIIGSLREIALAIRVDIGAGGTEHLVEQRAEPLLGVVGPPRLTPDPDFSRVSSTLG